MGALCGKEDHFDALERHGKGQKLGAAAPPASSSNAPTSTAAGSSAGGAAAGPPRSISTSPPQRLGGTADASGGGGTGDSAARREAMLAAAENRANKSAARGTKSGGGKLTQQLERQAKDGGRAEEARRDAERKGDEPLVVCRMQIRLDRSHDRRRADTRVSLSGTEGHLALEVAAMLQYAVLCRLTRRASAEATRAR